MPAGAGEGEPGGTSSSSIFSLHLLQGPYRHYILNALWILINLLCIMLTLYQLRRLYRDFTTKNLAAVRIAGLFTSLLSIQTEVGGYHHNHMDSNMYADIRS